MSLVTRSAAVLALAVLPAALCPQLVLAATVEIYPGPGVDTYKSDLYTVEVLDGTAWVPAYVYKVAHQSRCHWHFGETTSVHFVTFGTDGPVQVRVSKMGDAIRKVDASPHSKPVAGGTITNGQAVGTVRPFDKYWLTINEDDADPLFLFADPLKASVPPGATYFGPGVHDIAPMSANHYQARTGEAIYIDGGAWVRGNIYVTGTRNVRIMGPGVLSGDLWPRDTVKDVGFPAYYDYAMVKGDIEGANGATMSGVTIVDTPAYGFFGGVVETMSVKLISPWWAGTDAFPGVPHIDHTFCFSGDEAFRPHDAGRQGEDVTITHSFVGTSNNTCLNGGYWGFDAYKGYTALVDDVDIKTYENDDWVTGPNPAPLQASAIQILQDNSDPSFGYANQTYQNIHVDGDIRTPLLEMKNQIYPFNPRGSAGAADPPLGNSHDFIFRNIVLEGTSKYRSPIQGYDANNGYRNINLDNVRIGGTPVTGANLAQFFDVNAFVSGLAVTADADYLASVLPVVGSAPGSNGSYFKTSMQLYNPGTANFPLRLVYHPAGASGSPSDPSKQVTVLAGQVLDVPDLLPVMGIASGLGSLDVYLPVGETRKLAATFRVYNDGGSKGTSGFNEDLVPFNKFFVSGATVVLTCPPDPVKARLNVGVRTLGDGATIVATLRDASGATVQSVTKTYAPNYFEQTTLDAFLGGAPVSGNESLTLHVNAGQVVVYGATVDNTTNDSSASLAQRQ
jgi:hypothetical protein